MRRIEISPASPVRNDEQSPTAIVAAIGLNEKTKSGSAPELSFTLSGLGASFPADAVVEIPAAAGDVQTFRAEFVLPPEAGLASPETLSFVYAGTDDLENRSEEIACANSFQVYQGDLPPLNPPAGLSAESTAGRHSGTFLERSGKRRRLSTLSARPRPGRTRAARPVSGRDPVRGRPDLKTATTCTPSHRSGSKTARSRSASRAIRYRRFRTPSLPRPRSGSSLSWSPGAFWPPGSNTRIRRTKARPSICTVRAGPKSSISTDSSPYRRKFPARKPSIHSRPRRSTATRRPPWTPPETNPRHASRNT